MIRGRNHPRRSGDRMFSRLHNVNCEIIEEDRKKTSSWFLSMSEHS